MTHARGSLSRACPLAQPEWPAGDTDKSHFRAAADTRGAHRAPVALGARFEVVQMQQSAFEYLSHGQTPAAEIREQIGDLPTYLSFDVDAVDPAFAPGTGTPVPGGLTSRELLQLLRGLAGVRLVGMDVVEVCPPLDQSDATSVLAAHALFEGLALAALREPA